MRKQVVLLEHKANALAQGNGVFFGVELVDADAVHGDVAALRPKQTADAAQERRLARARRPDDRHGLAALHVEVDARQHRRDAETQMHVAE